jgi:hypothetical protein
MDHAEPMRVLERAQACARQELHLALVERPARQPVRQILAFDPRHRQVGLAGVVEAVRHVRHDAGMAQPREELGLAQEAARRIALRHAQPLERHQRAGLPITRSVHRAHASAADVGLDLEPAGHELPGAHRAP